MIDIYTVEQVAAALGCSTKTVEEMARRGEVAGIKPGGSWVFPAGALAKRLDEMAIEQAAERRKPVKPAASSTGAAVVPKRGSASRVRPVLVDMRGG